MSRRSHKTFTKLSHGAFTDWRKKFPGAWKRGKATFKRFKKEAGKRGAKFEYEIMGHHEYRNPFKHGTTNRVAWNVGWNSQLEWGVHSMPINFPVVMQDTETL